MADLLEYIVRLRGAGAASAEARGLAKSMQGVAGANREVAASNKMAAASARAGGGAMTVLGKGLKFGAVAAAAAGFEALKMGTNFDAAMERVHTQAGASQAEVDHLRGRVLALADVMPQSPQQMSEGLYHLESIGLRDAKAMDALKVAADGAAVGGADLEETATALGSAWLVNIKGAGGLHNVMGVLNATVGAGNMRMGDLVHSLGTGLLPAAKQAGLGLVDTMGALAVFTDEGYNASSASAQFATALHFLYNPTNKARAAMEGMGLSGNALARDMRKPQGLLVALKDLRSHLDLLPGGHSGVAAEQTLGQILPGGRGRILLTLLNQLDRYQMKLGQIRRTTGQFAEDVRRTHATAAFKLRTAWSSVQVSLIELGDTVKGVGVPMVVFATGVLAKTIHYLALMPHAISAGVRWWKGLPAPVHLVAEGLGLVVAQMMLMLIAARVFVLVKAGILAVRTAILVLRGAVLLFTLGSGPLMLALMALVAVAVLIVTHWTQTKALLMVVWHAIVAGFEWVRRNWEAIVLVIVAWPLLIALAFIQNFAKIRHAAAAAAGWVGHQFGRMVGFVKTMPGRIAHAAAGMWDGIKSAFRSALNWIIRAWNGLRLHVGIPHKVLGVTIPGGGSGVTINTPDIPLLANGGHIRAAGSAIVGDNGPEMLDLPRGASVTPLGYNGGDIVLKVSGRELARVYRREVLAAQAANG